MVLLYHAGMRALPFHGATFFYIYLFSLHFHDENKCSARGGGRYVRLSIAQRFDQFKNKFSQCETLYHVRTCRLLKWKENKFIYIVFSII